MALIDQIPDDELNDTEIDLEALRRENAKVDAELQLEIDRCKELSAKLK